MPVFSASCSRVAIPRRYPRYAPGDTRGGRMTDVASAPAISASTAVKPINHWISGQAYAGQSGRSGPVFNPATGEQSGAVDFATVEEVDKAVQAASQPFPPWRGTS